MRDLAADRPHAQNAQTLAGNRRSVDTPLFLPSAGVHVTISLTHVAGRCHQQHHGGIGDGRCVRVGTIGDRDAPPPGRVEIDGATEAMTVTLKDVGDNALWATTLVPRFRSS